MSWPEGSSEMATRVQVHDWAATPLGPVDNWPDSLRRTVEMLLAHPMPMALLWGDRLTQIHNDSYARLLGQRNGEDLGHAQEESWADFAQLHGMLVARIRAGESVLIDEMLYRHAGSGLMKDHWYMVAYSPVQGEERQVDGILLTVLETTERKEAEQRVRQVEERHAFLLRLNDAVRPLTDPAEVQRTAMGMVNERLGAIRSLYFELGPDGDTILPGEGVDLLAGDQDFAVPACVSDFGEWAASEFAHGRAVIIEDVDREARLHVAAREVLRRAGTVALVGLPLFKRGQLAAFISVQFNAPRSCTKEELQLLGDVAERVWDAVERARAESALRHSEERLRLMVAELQHRVRNILTVVRSVFTRTMEGDGEHEDMADHFRGRLDALARTQAIVTQTAAGTADLENLIRDELISVGVRDGPNVRIGGPDVVLEASVAESLGLALHELTTNALKYGALRVDGGRLTIDWSVRPEQGGMSHLDLTWQEEGVPVVGLVPLREGYGRELIEQALPYRLGATTTLEFRGGGIRCSISVPLKARAREAPSCSAMPDER